MKYINHQGVEKLQYKGKQEDGERNSVRQRLERIFLAVFLLPAHHSTKAAFTAYSPQRKAPQCGFSVPKTQIRIQFIARKEFIDISFPYDVSDFFIDFFTKKVGWTKKVRAINRKVDFGCRLASERGLLPPGVAMWNTGVTPKRSTYKLAGWRPKIFR